MDGNINMEKKHETVVLLEKRKELAQMVYDNYGGLLEECEKGYHDNEVYAAFQGYVKALHDIEKELAFCAVNKYKFPVLHLYDFIDRIFGKKK